MSAVHALAQATEAGMELRLEPDGLRWMGEQEPPPALLAQLGAHKAEIAGMLAGDACRHCGGAIDWRRPGALAFADGSGAHVACHEQAEIARLLAAGRRAVESADALADPGEVALHGEGLP
jgi:hypothetical protein